MEPPDEGAARDRTERDRAEQAQVSADARADARHLRERLRRLATEIGRTENDVAATYHRLAEQALQQGRIEDAQRLEREAAEALRAAAHEWHELDRWPAVPEPPEPDWARTGDRRAAARRLRDESAEERDEAARLRDVAARRRDELAVDRDLRAADRDEAAQRREDAAEERESAWARRAHRASTSSGVPSPGAVRDQAAIDAEVEDTYRGQAERDREEAAADRQVEAADRAQARGDRRAAARDRAAAAVDRAQADRDRVADSGDGEQAEIEQQTATAPVRPRSASGGAAGRPAGG